MEPDKKIQQLQQQLRESARASGFLESDTGQIAVELAKTEINKLVKDICSTKYLKDHMGYVNAISELRARQDWLKRLQVAGSPVRIAKIKEALDVREDKKSA